MQPKMAYHLSPTKNRQNILKYGLLASKGDAALMGGTGGIFFDSVPTSDNGFDTWAVNLKGLNVEPDDTTDISNSPEWTGHSWWVVWGQDISPDRLKLIKNK